MRAIFLVMLFGLVSGCAPPSPGSDGVPAGKIPPNSDEVIVVRPHGDKPFQVEVSAWHRGIDGRTWNSILAKTAGAIGPKGFAPLGEKHEGDGRTPTGVYRIGTAFGSDPTMETKLDYRQATADDFWVDDPDSPQYNRWVHGKPDAKSFEKLRIAAYRYAAVIEYNTNPVEKGKGSAIFLHIWGGPDKPTAGCVAVAEPEIVKLLAWLNKGQKPVIVLNP